MWTPFISAVAAFCGVIIGQMLARSNEYHKWLRTEQHSACARLLEAGEAYRTHKAVEVVVREIVREQATKFATTSPNARELIRELSEKQLGRPLEEAELEAVIPRVAAAFEASPDLASKLRQKMNEQLGRDDKTYFADAATAVERMRLAMEAVRLVCSDKIVSSADRLVAAAVALNPHGDSWEGSNGEYNNRRGEFVKDVRRHFIARKNSLARGK